MVCFIRAIINNENEEEIVYGINIMSWLLAAPVPLAPSDMGLEPNEQTELILWLIAAAISIIPVVVFFVSYLRVRKTVLLIATFAFFIFFLKATILAMKLFMPYYVDEFWWSIAAILDIIMISLVALSLSKKA
jgi:hypothetical protein